MSGEVHALPNELSEAEAASILSWWIEAGVDQAVGDEPRDWRVAPVRRERVMAEPPQEAKAPAVERAPAPIDVPTRPPASLAAFRSWWMETAALPLAGPGVPRAPIEGPEGAELLVIGDMPDDEGDGEGQPRAFAGDSEILLGRMLAAVGTSSDQVLRSAVAPVVVPGRRMGAADFKALGELSRQLVGLSGATRLLLLGDLASRALLGEPVVRARGRVHQLGGVRVVASFHPRQLMMRAGDKRLAWEDLLLLFETK